MALLGLEGALKHYYYYYYVSSVSTANSSTTARLAEPRTTNIHCLLPTSDAVPEGIQLCSRFVAAHKSHEQNSCYYESTVWPYLELITG
jgi:hypothetical protein